MDDDEQDRRAMGIVLQKAGFSDILYAASAEDGLQWVDVYHPDIILIDVVLKNVNGFDVCRQVREKKDLKNKIIMVTGHLEAVEAQKARTSGADEIVEKMPDFKILAETVKSMA